ncbi:MAG: ATP synthase F1 subunit delta [Candidatus Izimaplasma sp.]|nr:ATP synthase F1 subunit delta [Candidatus Izimaplasma bacterium]
MTDTAKQYAIALFSLASEKESEEDIYKEFKSLFEVIDDNLSKFFLNPKIDDLEKHKVFDKVIQQKLLLNFIKTVIVNNRFDIIDDILEAYKVLLNDSKNITEIIVYTDHSLSKKNKDILIKRFENKLNKKIIINEVVRQSIVGGLRIEYHGRVIDQTINSTLADIKSSLIG